MKWCLVSWPTSCQLRSYSSRDNATYPAASEGKCWTRLFIRTFSSLHLSLVLLCLPIPVSCLGDAPKACRHAGLDICHIEIHDQVLECHALDLHQGLGIAKADRAERLALLYQCKGKPWWWSPCPSWPSSRCDALPEQFHPCHWHSPSLCWCCKGRTLKEKLWEANSLERELQELNPQRN